MGNTLAGKGPASCRKVSIDIIHQQGNAGHTSRQKMTCLGQQKPQITCCVVARLAGVWVKAGKVKIQPRRDTGNKVNVSSGGGFGKGGKAACPVSIIGDTPLPAVQGVFLGGIKITGHAKPLHLF